MKLNLRKGLAVTSSLALLASMLPGSLAYAGEAVPEKWEPFAENVTISIPVYEFGLEGYPATDKNYWTDWAQKEFGDKYNITLNYVPIPRFDVMTKYAQLMAGGDTPTILAEYDYPKVAQWANDGAMQVIDLEEFAEWAPTYYGKMVENNQLDYTDIGGEDYFVLSERPYYETQYNYVGYVRMDWLKQVGMDHVPESYQEYCEAIRLIQEAGISEHPGYFHYLPTSGYLQNFQFRDWPANEEEWAMHSSLGVPGLAWDASKKMLRRLNREYNEGWYSSEFELDISGNGTQTQQDFINGKIFEYSGYVSNNIDFLTSFYEKNPDAELAIASIYEETDGEDVVAPVYRSDNPFGMVLGFSSLATEDELHAAWMYLEWMIQPENLFTWQHGEEGKTFEYGEDGLPVQLEVKGTEYEDMMLGIGNNSCYWGLVIASEKKSDDLRDQIIASAPLGYPQDFTDQILKHYEDQLALFNEGKAYTDPVFKVAIDSESEYSATLLSDYQEYFVKLVKCPTEEFDELWDECISEYLDSGYQEIIDERQEAYQAGLTSHLPDNAK